MNTFLQEKLQIATIFCVDSLLSYEMIAHHLHGCTDEGGSQGVYCEYIWQTLPAKVGHVSFLEPLNHTQMWAVALLRHSQCLAYPKTCPTTTRRLRLHANTRRLGILRDLQAFFWLRVFFCSQAESTPAPAPVTPTVGQP